MCSLTREINQNRDFRCDDGLTKREITNCVATDLMAEREVDGGKVTEGEKGELRGDDTECSGNYVFGHVFSSRHLTHEYMHMAANHK